MRILKDCQEQGTSYARTRADELRQLDDATRRFAAGPRAPEVAQEAAALR
jgi:hypothetical protein